MIPERYEEALADIENNVSWHQSKAYPLDIGEEENDDYLDNDDIPSFSEEYYEGMALDVLNYYYFWFPLVKDHI